MGVEPEGSWQSAGSALQPEAACAAAQVNSRRLVAVSTILTCILLTDLLTKCSTMLYSTHLPKLHIAIFASTAILSAKVNTGLLRSLSNEFADVPVFAFLIIM